MSKRDLHWSSVPLLTLFLLASALAQSDSNPAAIESATAGFLSFIEPLATSLTFPNGGSATGLAKGDFNGDGQLDLAVTQITNVVGVGNRGFVSVMLGKGDASFQAPINLPIPYDPNLGGFARGILAKDFDHDGILDLVVDVGEQRKVLFFKGHGDGTFNDPVGFNTIDRCIEVQAADLNGDGNLDVVALNSLLGDHSVSVLLGNGDGTFKSANAYATNMQPDSVALVDVDGKNRADIVIGCYGDGNNSPSVDVLLNNGSGLFPPVTTRFTQRFQVTGLYAADFDGDSKVDVVATGFGGPTDRSLVLIKGNGDGTFVSPPDQNFQAVEDLSVGSTRFSENAAPDLDGDGRPDVLITHAAALNIVTAGLGRGDGHFDTKELVASNGPGFAQDSGGNTPTADGNSTNTAISGDFNGDGKQDLVVASESGNGGRPGGVSILLGAGQGKFLAPHSEIALSGSGFVYAGNNDRSTALADFNGDGKLDLVTLDTGSEFPFPHIADVLPGNGDGAFGAPIAALGGTSGLGTGVNALRVADMNRDGKLDLIVTSSPAGVQGNAGTTATRVAYGAGNGTFTYAVELPPGDPSWTIPNLVVADLNGDGAPDIAVLTAHGFNPNTGKEGRHIEVFIQKPNQAGAFTRAAGFPQSDLGENNGNGIVAADFDGDGKLDLIAGGGGTGSSAPDQVMFLKGNGDGTFQPAVAVGTILLGQARMFDVRAIDLNNDGKLDLLATGFNGISVYLGNGNGNFQPPVSYSSGGGNSPSSDIADLDGDGRPDVAFGNVDGGFTVLRGRGDGTFAAPIYFAMGYFGARSIRTGDLNGDGKPDVVVGHGIGTQENIFATVLINNSPTVQFSSATFSVSEGSGSATITVTRVGDASVAATVDYATTGTAFVPCNVVNGVASQNCDYTVASGTLTFAPGETLKTFTVLIVDDLYVEGNETLSLNLSSPTGAALGSPSTAGLTITDNDTINPPSTNPLDNLDALFFIRQQYLDFLNREPDADGWAYWANQITECGANTACVNARRIRVSDAFFFEPEFQKTGSYVLRLYRIAYGDNQPFPNPDPGDPSAPFYPGPTFHLKFPSYAKFKQDRAQVVGGPGLAQSQLALANAFVGRPEFLTKYSAGLSGPDFVNAVLATISSASGIDLTSQSGTLNSLYTQGGRGLVMFHLANDYWNGCGPGVPVPCVPPNVGPAVDNRPLIDAGYNLVFVTTEYFGYLRRDGDANGLNFWLVEQVNRFPLRNPDIEHAMVCSFITSVEYQQRFSPVATHTNAECPQ